MFENYGLSAAGFNRPRLTDIKTILQKELETTLNITIPADPESIFQQIIGVFSASLADTWENMERVYYAMYPLSAEGINLKHAVSFSGIQQVREEKTQIPVTLYGINNTLLPAPTVVGSNVDSTLTFSVDDGATITAQNASYAEVAVNTVIDNTNYSITIAGTPYTFNSGIGATAGFILAGLAALINDASVVDDKLIWQKAEEYPGSVVVVSTNLKIFRVGSPILFSCDVYGAIDPAVNTIQSQVTVVAGYDACNNKVVAVTVGRDQETDQALRLRYDKSVYRLGKALVDSLAAHLYEDVEGVTAALVLENDTDIIDGDGRPPHSIECIVQGGADADIGQTIWHNKCAGITTFGDETVTIKDTQGFNHDINFNRPTVKLVWLKVTLTANGEEEFPADTGQRVIDILVAEGAKQTIGQDVITQKFYGPIYKGTTGVGTVLIEYAVGEATPVAYLSGNIDVTARELAMFDLARITVLIA